MIKVVKVQHLVEGLQGGHSHNIVHRVLQKRLNCKKKLRHFEDNSEQFLDLRKQSVRY